MSEQTFMFCVGANKAGTSWLYDFLRGHPDCHMRAVKELHYFDAIETGESWQEKAHRDALAKASARVADGSANAYQTELASDLQKLLPLYDGGDLEAYRDYVTDGAGDARLVGDITPSYALLQRATYKTMATLTDKVRFVLLLRDPVERAWSNIRMMAGAQGQEALDRKLDDVIAGRDMPVLDRSNYRRTLNRLTRAIPREMLHVEFYERLFTPEAIERLCVFLGIAPHSANFDRVVHKSVSASLPDARRAQLRDTFKQQYNFVDKFMGELPTQWTQKMVNA